jgi:serine/threonine protein kinase
MCLEGYLWKPGRKIKDILRKRWFVLKDNFLYWFKDPRELRPAGIIFIEGCFVDPIPESPHRDLFAFEIVVSEEKGKSKMLFAKTAQERDDWMNAIKKASQVFEFSDFYELGKELGTGKFSAVHECTHKTTAKKFAVKIINKTELSDKDRESLRTEIAILQLVNHPNVIHLKNVFDQRHKIFIVMGLVEGGDLFDRLAKRKRMDELTTRSIIQKLLNTVNFLHGYGIVHRDLVTHHCEMF